MPSTLSLDAAQRIAHSSLARAAEMQVAVAVVVVDTGGHPVVSLRTDGATFLHARIAAQKAVTSAGTGGPTAALVEALGEMPALLAGLSSQPDIAVIPGGLPLLVDGELVGGLGVSGGPGGEDVPIAEAGAASLRTA
jgi:uncharacterized protein GlcG (DUF336 family)